MSKYVVRLESTTRYYSSIEHITSAPSREYHPIKHTSIISDRGRKHCIQKVIILLSSTNTHTNYVNYEQVPCHHPSPCCCSQHRGLHCPPISITRHKNTSLFYSYYYWPFIRNSIYSYVNSSQLESRPELD